MNLSSKTDKIIGWNINMKDRKIQKKHKDLSRVKPDFKSVPLQFYFEIVGLTSAGKWREIQNMTGEERF